MCLVCSITYVPGLHHDAEADANEHGLRAAQLPEASPRACQHRPPELGSTFLRVAPGPAGPERPGSHGGAHDVDGDRGLAARRRSAEGRRTSVRLPLPNATPDLNPRMLHRPRSLRWTTRVDARD